MKLTRIGFAMVALFAILAAGCTSDQSQEADVSSVGQPVVVATTAILGDVVENLVGDQFDVVTIMPAGADPHSFQPSAQDLVAMTGASAIVSNGALFEEGLLDALEAAEGDGVQIFEAMSVIDAIEGAHIHGDDHDDHDDHGDEDHDDHKDDHGDEDHDDQKDDHDDHGDEDHDDHDDHGDEDHDDHDDHGEVAGVDPHFFTDPTRMAVAARGIVDFLASTVESIDATELQADAADYIEELTSLGAEVEETLSAVPAARRVMVTNHQVFGYFAERFGFEVVGTVIPAGSTNDGVSGRRLAELTSVLEREGVTVVFTDASASDDLARTLATEVGDVAIVPLYSESLGSSDSGADTYVGMVRSNATQIANALAG